MQFRRSTSLWFFALLWTVPAWGAQELRFGQQGNLTWEGEVSGLEDVSTSLPEYRPVLAPNTTEIGIAPGGLIQLSHPDYPGALLPLQVDEDDNLSETSGKRGGGIKVPGIRNDQEEEALRTLLTPKSTGTAFERKGTMILGAQLDLDLGAIVGVNMIRFFPRNTVFPAPEMPFQDDFLRNFEVRIHDGVQLNEVGLPALGSWETFLSVEDNAERVTQIPIDPPRYLRFIRLRATSSIPFEIEKLQVFGEGFFPSARYVSPVIDLGTPSNWGQIRWQQEILGKRAQTDLVVRTRTGSDDTPFVYSRRQVGRLNASEVASSVDNPGQPLSRREFGRLPVKGGQSDTWERGSVREDLEHWSPWSTPYAVAAGTSPEGARNTSPAPKRYFQFRVDFLSRELRSSHVLNGITFEFTRPALADTLVAEIFPRAVQAARDIAFVYAVRAKMGRPDLQGFNAFEISTQSRVRRIERLEIIDGASGQSVVDHTFAENAVGDAGEVAITALDDAGFALRFPHIDTDDTILKIHFVNRVFAYSTDFDGRALIQETEAFQRVQSGDADDLGQGDSSLNSGITVLSPSVTNAKLIGDFTAGAAIVTPNGDGANDWLQLSFEVLTVVGEADIRLQIFDLGGRRRATIFEHRGGNGLYAGADFAALNWSGSGDKGGLLPPGLYLLRLEVEGDARSSTAVRPVGIAY